MGHRLRRRRTGDGKLRRRGRRQRRLRWRRTPPPPPPPQEPPVFTTATAVRVTGPRRSAPAVSPCRPVRPRTRMQKWNRISRSIRPTRTIWSPRGSRTACPTAARAAWQRRFGRRRRHLEHAAGIAIHAVCGRRVCPRVRSLGRRHGPTVLQIGIAFTGAAFAVGARSAVLVSRSGRWRCQLGRGHSPVDDDGTRFFNDKESSPSTRRTRATCTPLGPPGHERHRRHAACAFHGRRRELVATGPDLRSGRWRDRPSATWR